GGGEGGEGWVGGGGGGRLALVLEEDLHGVAAELGAALEGPVEPAGDRHVSADQVGRRGGGATGEGHRAPPGAGQGLGIQGQYFAMAPPSTRRSKPVIISAAPEARDPTER